jgi:hypothetical protein
MALLFLDSFDHYQAGDLTAKWTGAGFQSGGDFQGYTIRAGYGRCGTAGLQMGRLATVYRGIAFGTQPVTVGFAFILLSAHTDPGRNFVIGALNNVNGQNLAFLSYNADGSLATLTTNGFGDPAAAVGVTPPNLIHMDVWYFLEWRVKLDATVGSHAVQVNNILQITVAGINTLPTTAVSGGNLPRQFGFLSSGSAGGQCYFVDDFYALDATGPAPQNTFLGDCRVEYLRPRAAGALQQWSVTGVSAHWSAVDDNATPDQDATYVEANAAGLTDTNRYTPTGLPVGPIFGAQLNLYAEKTAAGPRVIAPVVGGTVGPAVGPSQNSYAYFSSISPTNPATGLPWTIAEINAIDAGVTVVS